MTEKSTLIRAVDEYPKGYGKAAAFETCDPNFLIYRKFEWLHARVLLHIQDELQELEEKLESYDKWQFSKGKYRNLSSRRKDDDEIRPQRKKILEKIKAKLAEYGESHSVTEGIVLMHLQTNSSSACKRNRQLRSQPNAIRKAFTAS